MNAFESCASKSARSRYRRGLSTNGRPEVGQAVTQVPHSLQKSVRTAIWSGWPTANGVEPVATTAPSARPRTGSAARTGVIS